MTKVNLIESPDEFLATLEKSQLFNTEQIAAVRNVAAKATDPIQIARLLIKKGWLTKWQASQLLSGFHSLFFGKYKLCDQLGKGELGNVYLAENPKLGRKIALKALSKRNSTQPELIKRFLAEAQAAAALDHPNIVHVHDVSSEGDRHFVVMEHVDGRDLQTTVDADGPLSIEKACDYIQQSAEGLKYAHSEGVVHGDLKPANLMVDRDGTVKILDVGVGQIRQSVAETAAEAGEPPPATLGFTAPEQAQKHTTDERTDIYSLGGVLYFLLTGRAPFAAKTAEERAKIQTSNAPLPIEDLRSDVSPELAAVCSRMMAQHPEDRFESVAAFVGAIAEAQGTVAVIEPEPASSTSEETAPASDTPQDVATDESKDAPIIVTEAEPTEKVSNFHIDLGEGKGPAAGSPANFSIDTKRKRKKKKAKAKPAKPAQEPSPADEPADSQDDVAPVAAEKLDESVDSGDAVKPAAVKPAAAKPAAAAAHKPQHSAPSNNKSLLLGIVIGGVCVAVLMLAIGGGVAMFVFGRSGQEVAQADTTDEAAGKTEGPDAASDAAEATTGDEDAAGESPADSSDESDPQADDAAEPSDSGESTKTPPANPPAPVSDDAKAGTPTTKSGTPKDKELAVAQSTAAEQGSDTATPATEPAAPAKTPKPSATTPAPKPQKKPTPAPTKKKQTTKQPPAKAPPKKKAAPTFVFKPALDLPAPDDANEFPLGTINIGPSDAVFISMFGGETAARGKSEFALQNAQDGVAPRDWEFYLKDGSSDPLLIATMSMPEKQLTFKWTTGAAKSPVATNLRNCSLKITAGQGKPQELALRIATTIAPLPIDLDKSNTSARYNLPGPPDPSSLRLEISVNGAKAAVEPPQLNISKGGKAKIFFGENQEQAALMLQLTASMSTRGLSVKVEPYFLVPGEKTPQRLNKANRNKYANIGARRPQIEAAIKQIESGTREQQRRFQNQLLQAKQALQMIDQAVTRMQKLDGDITAVNNNTTLSFRVFADTLQKQIDLMVTDANLPPGMP